MKIENRENVKGNIKTTVVFGGEKYSRLEKSVFTGLDMKPVVEWKKVKTNHIVNADKFKILEEKFIEVDTTRVPVRLYTETKNGPAQITSSGSTPFYDFQFKASMPKGLWEIGRHSEQGKNEKKAPEYGLFAKQSFPEMSKDEKKAIDDRIFDHLKHGSLLSAIKYLKEMTGLGLKEAKEYVDELNRKYLLAKRAGEPFSGAQVTANREIEHTLPNNAKRKQFQAEIKKFFSENGSKLMTVKQIKDTTGWGLYTSKYFFDTYIE